MVNKQKNTSKKATLNTITEEADSHASDLQTGGVREEGGDEEGEDDDYVRDGYYKDGYHYDHDQNLLRVTKDLETTHAKLAEQKRLTTKMKKMMERL
uniref:Uncharacterized protein n=1 Tax=Cannabis sativa TaxID=3483 RepID=A0A803PA47_CANSA